MTHEGPLDLVRQHPEIAVGLIKGTPGIRLPRRAAVSLAPTDMSAVVPVQYLADMVVLISDAATGQPALAVIIEPQLRDSETKRFSWPVYVTTARRLAGCPAAVLVVICPDPAEAAKCRQLIRTGHPGFDLAPIVIDSNAPPGFDGAGGPYLTLFAASVGGIDLASETGARAVLDAMSDPVISEAERLQLTIIIMRLASDAARQSLEAMMHTSEYEKTFVEELRDQGKAEGHVEGKAEGLVEGEARSVLRILDARRLAPSEEQRQRVISCTDAAQLDLWLDRAITADTVDEIFAD
jgi:hypothetical protein